MTSAEVNKYFGAYVLDLARAELRRTTDQQPLALNAQPFKVLAYLVSRAGEVVSREELQKHVWGETIVEYDQGINACIRQIRAVTRGRARGRAGR